MINYFSIFYLTSEIQPKNLQKEAEEWEFCETQLPLLLLCCWQQGSFSLCLGEPPHHEFLLLLQGGQEMGLVKEVVPGGLEKERPLLLVCPVYAFTLHLHLVSSPPITMEGSAEDWAWT